MLLLAVGVTLLFAPEVVFPAPNVNTSQPLVLAQLLGAALLGFARRGLDRARLASRGHLWPRRRGGPADFRVHRPFGPA